LFPYRLKALDSRECERWGRWFLRCGAKPNRLGSWEVAIKPWLGKREFKFRLELLDGRLVVWRDFQTELGTTRLPKLDVLQPNAFISRLGQLYLLDWIDSGRKTTS
jgi:hypothetical protein